MNKSNVKAIEKEIDALWDKKRKVRNQIEKEFKSGKITKKKLISKRLAHTHEWGKLTAEAEKRLIKPKLEWMNSPEYQKSDYLRDQKKFKKVAGAIASLFLKLKYFNLDSSVEITGDHYKFQCNLKHLHLIIHEFENAMKKKPGEYIIKDVQTIHHNSFIFEKRKKLVVEEEL